MAIPGQETEWDIIQRKMGNLPPKEVAVSEAELQAMIQESAEQFDPLEHKTLDELDELEDDEDDRILQEYRDKRIAEMKAQMAKRQFGTLRYYSADEFVREITNDSKEATVVLLLEDNGQEESNIMRACLQTLAPKFPHTKFARMKATDVIPKYPTRNIPTILLYRNADVVTQWVTLQPFGGAHCTPDDVEWQLAQFDAVESELEEDPKTNRQNRVFVNVMQSRMQSRSQAHRVQKRGNVF